MRKYCNRSDLNHVRRVQIAYNGLSKYKMVKMIPCPGVRILKTILCFAACPAPKNTLVPPWELNDFGSTDLHLTPFESHLVSP